MKDSNKIVFLDRDGTINVDYGYVFDEKKLKILPGAIKGMKMLKDKGYTLILVTNQSGIGRGYYTEKQYKNFNRAMFKILTKEKIKIKKVFYCPHAPEIDCFCRKPETKKVKEYLKKLDMDKSNSYAIGDKTSDIKFGDNLKIKTILVKTGKAGKDDKYKVKPYFIAKNLEIAAKLIIKDGNKPIRS